MAMEHPFLRNEMLWGPEAQRRLFAAHVILFGLGGVGSYTAECLARAGIGELTIVDSDIAHLDHSYYPNIDISIDISFPQRSSWAVRKTDKWLADSINEWAKQKAVIDTGHSLFHHYFETDKTTSEGEINIRMLKRGIVSRYDAFFKQEAKHIGWDWKLLAAQG